MWKKYKEYHIHENGKIIGLSGRIIKGTTNSKGYLQTTGKDKKKYLIHRLVAECFLKCPGDFESYQVNHIDGNKTNNCIQNLEWLTPKQHVEVDRNRRINKNMKYND